MTRQIRQSHEDKLRQLNVFLCVHIASLFSVAEGLKCLEYVGIYEILDSILLHLGIFGLFTVHFYAEEVGFTCEPHIHHEGIDVHGKKFISMCAVILSVCIKL